MPHAACRGRRQRRQPLKNRLRSVPKCIRPAGLRLRRGVACKLPRAAAPRINKERGLLAQTQRARHHACLQDASTTSRNALRHEAQERSAETRHAGLKAATVPGIMQCLTVMFLDKAELRTPLVCPRQTELSPQPPNSYTSRATRPTWALHEGSPQGVSLDDLRARRETHTSTPARPRRSLIYLPILRSHAALQCRRGLGNLS